MPKGGATRDDNSLLHYVECAGTWRMPVGAGATSTAPGVARATSERAWRSPEPGVVQNTIHSFVAMHSANSMGLELMDPEVC